VRNILVAGGAAPDQITLTSYGEERPAVAGRGESSWAQNRRAELSY
jgi:peptidoglycan-associated lipoprotein